MWCRFRVMVLNATFNNISVISCPSILLVKQTGVPGENYRPAAIIDKLYRIALYRLYLAWAGCELPTSVVICTDCIGNCKSSYIIVTAMTAPIDQGTSNMKYKIRGNSRLWLNILYGCIFTLSRNIQSILYEIY